MRKRFGKKMDRCDQHKKSVKISKGQSESGGELRCSGKASSYCCTSDIRRVTLATDPVISHELGKERIL